MRQTSSVVRIIEAVDKPLGFFVLALLIVEVFLILVLVLASDIDASARINFVWAGIALFLVVVLVVTLIVWFKPTNLTFTERGSLQQMRLEAYGSSHRQVPVGSLPSGVPRSG